MRLAAHITTCHRDDVKCRPRPHEGPDWNVREWTQEERLNISKNSFNSILNFLSLLEGHGHEVDLYVIDDNSNYPPALDWLNSISSKVKIIKSSVRGSSAGVNQWSDVEGVRDSDYVLHLEDDNLLFNPLNIDWLSVIDKIAKKNNNIVCYTFRSGLPVDKHNKGFSGDWGPKGAGHSDDIYFLLFNRLGNAHHIMKTEDYIKFLPLAGNTGGCEASMNNQLMSLGKNAEPQIHVHCFHSHMWEYPIDTNKLQQWHKTGEGFEYGHKDMSEFLKDKNTVISEVYTSFPNKKNTISLNDYYH